MISTPGPGSSLSPLSQRPGSGSFLQTETAASGRGTSLTHGKEIGGLFQEEIPGAVCMHLHFEKHTLVFISTGPTVSWAQRRKVHQ